MSIENAAEFLSPSVLLAIFLLVILPGTVGMYIFRLFVSFDELDWQKSVFESVFWGTLNLFAAVPWYLFFGLRWETLAAVLIFPVLGPIVGILLLRHCSLLRKYLVFPFKTAFDCAVNLKKIGPIVLVHLKNGKVIAGFVSEDSYFTTYPHSGDLLLGDQIILDESEQPLNLKSHSRALIIPAESWDYIEILDEKSIQPCGSDG